MSALIVTASVVLGCGGSPNGAPTTQASTTYSPSYCVDSESGETVNCGTPGSVEPPASAGPPENCVPMTEPWNDDYCSGIKPDGTPCRPRLPPWHGPDPSGCELLEDLRSEYEAEHGG